MLHVCLTTAATLFLFHFYITHDVVYAQVVIKEGSCPPPLSRSICYNQCSEDQHCPDNEKCCLTMCGGTTCISPVTARKNSTIVKKGQCPPITEGEWFCTSMCTSDGDCRGTRKCCHNRCGALTCKLPLRSMRSNSSNV